MRMSAGLRILALLMLAPLLALALLAPPAAARPADEVRGTYAALVRALVERDAERALARFTAASLEEWARLRALALRGARDEVEALAPGPRLAVLALRHAAPVWLLRDGPPHELAGHAVRAGLLDERAAAQVELADVAILDGGRALGQLYALGLPSGFRAGFRREAGVWKLDLAATLEGVGRVVSLVARSSGTSENAVIVNLITAASGERVGPHVWEPLLAE